MNTEGLKSIITAENVSFQYKDSPEPNLISLNFQIAPSKIYLICGPTGSGKTTFIRSLNGLIPHFYHGTFYGYLKVKEQDTIENTPAKLAQTVGVVFQNPENQLFAMDVERDLAFGLENQGFSRNEIKKRLEHVFQVLRIENLKHRHPYQLSGGEQQKVAIASLLALEPDILVFDEPLSNLDPHSAKEMVGIFKQLRDQLKKTIIITEHRLEYLLLDVDEIILLQNGKLVQKGVVKEIIEQDLIYALKIDLPPLIVWLKQLRDKKFFQGSIPTTLVTQKTVLADIFSKCDLKKLEYNFKKSSSISGDSFKKPPSVTESNPLILFKHVNFDYIQGNIKTRALSDVSLTINPGEIVGIVGPNGAGKSTLVRCLNGLRRPLNGEIWIDGQNIAHVPDYKLAQIVGLIFQNPDHQLFANSIEDELKFSLKNLHLNADLARQRIIDTLNRLQLDPLKDRSPFLVSGGQRKKVSLASILCRQPRILVFDEPTIGQDAKEKQDLINLIKEERKNHTTVLIVSHDLDFIAHTTTRLIVMVQGQIFADGSPNEIFTSEKVIQRGALYTPEIILLLRQLQSQFANLPDDLITTEQLEEIIHCR